MTSTDSKECAVDITAKFLAEKSNSQKVDLYRHDAEELVNFKQRAKVLAMTKDYFPLLTVKELKQRFKIMGLSTKGLTEKGDMVSRLQDATEDNDEYVMVWQVKQTIGIKLERTNDWGVVLQKNPGIDLPIIGSVLTRINNESVLLKPHRELENLLKMASWPLELQFRRPPVKKGILIKQSRAVKGYKNWKKRFFVLESGNLSYFDKEGGKHKGTFSLRNLKGSQCMVTLAPRKLLSGNEVGVMIVKGDDLLVLKGETPEEMMEWAAVIYYAVSLHNGGNPDIFELEARRLERIAQNEEKKRQTEEAVTLQALASEEERTRRLKEEAEQAMELLQTQEEERLALAEEKRTEEAALLKEQGTKLAKALEQEQKEDDTRKEVEALKASLEQLQKEKEAAEKAAEDALQYKEEQEAILKKQLEEAQLSVEAANKKLEEGESTTVEAAVDTAKKSAIRRSSVAMASAREKAGSLTDQEEQDLAEKAAMLIISESEDGASGDGDGEDSDDEGWAAKHSIEVTETKALPGSTFHLSAPSGLVVDRSKAGYAPKYVKDDKAWML